MTLIDHDPLRTLPKSVTKLISLLTWLVTGLLLFFTLRRWLFIIVALMGATVKSGTSKKNGRSPSPDMPPVLLLIPFYNEAETLPTLLKCLNRLDYPIACLKVIFIDDGSTDHSADLLHQHIARYAHWHLLHLPQNNGKAKALNLALQNEFGDHFSKDGPGQPFDPPKGSADIIAIYDADERPQPDALRHLVTGFSQAQIGAVSGRWVVSNPLASPAASYTSFENLVHQRITVQAKDRLNLAPPILGGNCAYYLQALVEVGGFPEGDLLEDSDLTLRLTYAGWKTRYIPQAVCYHQAPVSLSGYWRQHVRWARGFYQVSPKGAEGLLAQAPTYKHNLSLLMRLELFAFSLGYLDRLALMAGVILSLFQPWTQFPRWLLGLYLVTPFSQTLAALTVAQAPFALWRRLIWLPIFFMVDIAMALTSTIASLRSLPQVWESRQAHR